MSDRDSLKPAVARIESLHVRNYRALRDVELKGLKPLSTFLGPNGSGKSTVFDVFAFLSECFTSGLRRAWDKRGRFRELRTRSAEGPIEIELKYREKPDTSLVTYHIAIEEESSGPFVAEEWLQWKRSSWGKPFKFLDFQRGKGGVISGEQPDEQEARAPEELESPELLAVSTLGQLAKHPRVGALRRFISGWHLSYLSADATRGHPQAGPQERLSSTGDNLPNVIQYLKERHPERLGQILKTLSQRVPRLERVDAEPMQDGSLLLQIKDAPFERPVLARFASDGTLMMLSYLTLLYDPSPPEFIGIEEPENHLHPRLLPELAEECRIASDRTQLLITTHSPFFVNGLSAQEVWLLHRDANGFTQARRTADVPGVPEHMGEGGQLGHLWMEGYFDIGDPFSPPGGSLPGR